MRRLGTALVLVMGACTVAEGAPEARPCRAAGREGCPQPGTPASDPLEPLGRADTSSFIEITDIVAHDELAFVCTGVRGLSIFDTSAEKPTLLVEKVAPGDGLSHGRFPRCQHVAFDAQARRVVITNRGDEVQPQPWLALYDVADPARPRWLSTWTPARGSIEGVALVGDRVFAALHTEGVVALRHDGDALLELGRVEAPETDAWQPLLGEDGLFVAEGEAGVRFYDVAEDVPVLRSTTEVAGSSRDLVREGSRLYVATSGGIAIVEVDDPNEPVVVVEFPTEGSPLDLALLGPEQIVVAQWDALRGYDFSDPTNPQPLLTEAVPTTEAFSRVLAVGTEPQRQRVFGGEWTGLHAFAYQAAPGPEVEASPRSLQFGEVTPGAPTSQVMLVANRGSTPLTVHDVAGPPGTTVDETCFVLDPGRTAAVEVELEVESTAPLRSAVRICSDDPDEPDLEVPLTANARGVSVGDPVPAFALRDLEGNDWSVADLEGKVAVLAYFATF